jgi:hypothetical protein
VLHDEAGIVAIDRSADLRQWRRHVDQIVAHFRVRMNALRMKLSARLFFATAIAIFATHELPAFAAAPDSTKGIQYFVDYGVPDSPALVAIGASPEQVLRGSAAKPATAHLVNAFQNSDKIASGLALDFSPYLTYFGKLTSVDEYRASKWKRLASNTELSLATVQDLNGRDSLLFGVGLRLTLFDSHDLLASQDLASRISKALANAASAGEPTDDDVITTGPHLEDVATAYRNTVAEIRNTPGNALAVGWAAKSELRHAVASVDSFTTFRNRAWMAYEQYFRAGRGLRATLLWKQSDDGKSTWRGGAALSSAGPRFEVDLEGYFDTAADQSGHTIFGLSGSGEYQLSEGLALVGVLGTQPEEVGHDTVSKLRLKTSLRWSYLGQPSK